MNCTKCGTADFYESIFFGGFDCRNPDCEYGSGAAPAPTASSPLWSALMGAPLLATTGEIIKDRGRTGIIDTAAEFLGLYPEEVQGTELERLCRALDIDIVYVSYGAQDHNRPRPSNPDWNPPQSWRVSLTREDENGRPLSLKTDFFGGGAAEEPTAAGVLDCLLGDIAGVDSVDSFEEWADCFGYDTDSRKAEAIFRKCAEQALDVHDFLGNRFSEFADAEH